MRLNYDMATGYDKRRKKSVSVRMNIDHYTMLKSLGAGNLSQGLNIVLHTVAKDLEKELIKLGRNTKLTKKAE